jgi:hypothetical protein
VHPGGEGHSVRASLAWTSGHWRSTAGVLPSSRTGPPERASERSRRESAPTTGWRTSTIQLGETCGPPFRAGCAWPSARESPCARSSATG